MFDKCTICKKPLVCESNLKTLRTLILGGTLGGCILGAVALPLLGFGMGGIAAGSIAAGWQSSIGAVTAGSLFAVLQSLGATGVGTLLFGGIGSGLGLLTTAASRLNWCTCNNSMKKKSVNESKTESNKTVNKTEKYEKISQPDD